MIPLKDYSPPETYRGLRIFDCDTREYYPRRHEKALKMVDEVIRIANKINAMDKAQEERLRIIATYEDRKKKEEDRLYEIKSELASWGYIFKHYLFERYED